MPAVDTWQDTVIVGLMVVLALGLFWIQRKDWK